MKATEITASWKSLSGFIFDKVTGANTDTFTDEEYETINANAKKVLNDVGADMVIAQARKILNLNILDKNFSLDIFTKIPAAWVRYYGTSIDIVASESSQYIMAPEEE